MQHSSVSSVHSWEGANRGPQAQLGLQVLKSGGASVTPIPSGSLDISFLDISETGFLDLDTQSPAGLHLCFCLEGSALLQIDGGGSPVRMEAGQVKVVDGSLRIRPRTPLRAALVRLPLDLAPGEGAESMAASGRWRWIETSLAAKMVGDCLAAFAGQMEGRSSSRQLESALRLANALLRELLTRPRPAAPLPARDAIPFYVIAAERQIQNPSVRPVSVSELARSTGVSPRTLHDGFRKHRGASPMRFLRDQKLESVRHELLHPSSETSVTDCALKWGFNHLGRFSSYYLKRFGEKPSDTLRHARTSPAAQAARAS